MWWRVIIVWAVILFLVPALYKYFWRFPALVRVYHFFAFKDVLRPTEQGVHFFLGMMSLPTLRLLADWLQLQFVGEYFIFLFPSFSSAVWSVIAALAGAIVKEITDVIAAGHWQPRDSLTDVGFWLLGGLVAPLFWPYMHM
jgi:hypothetical protein